MNREWLARVANDAQELGVPLPPAMTEALGTYANLLVAWNEKVNLTAITDDEGIAIRHFVDSLSVVPLVPEGATLIDVGTGAGFPGIPVALVRSDVRVTLLDSLDKRVNFLNAVTCELALKNARTQHGQIGRASWGGKI